MSRVQARRAAQTELVAARQAVDVLMRPPARPRGLSALLVHQQQLVRAYRKQASAAWSLAVYFRPDSLTQVALLTLGNVSTTFANRLDDELLSAAGGR